MLTIPIKSPAPTEASVKEGFVGASSYVSMNCVNKIQLVPNNKLNQTHIKSFQLCE